MPGGLFACRCRRPTRKKSAKPSQAEIASSRADEEGTEHGAKRTSNQPGKSGCRSLGVAPTERRPGRFVADIGKAGCAATFRWPLFERMVGERPHPVWP